MTEPKDVVDIGLTGRKKVLVAEDEQNIASLLEDWLSDTFEVMLAYNGAAALQKAKWNKPDVLILDVMMPDTGGYEVVCALQGDPITSKIPVIVMTAKNFDDSTIKLIKAEPNVFGFLNKPFKPDELKKQIAQVMTGQRTFPPPTGVRRVAPGAASHPAAAPAAVPLPPPTPGPTLAPPVQPPIPVPPPFQAPPPSAPPPSEEPAAFGVIHGYPEPEPDVPAPPVPPAAPPSAPPSRSQPPLLRPESSAPAAPPSFQAVPGERTVPPGQRVGPPRPAKPPPGITPLGGLVEPTSALPPPETGAPLPAPLPEASTHFRPMPPPKSKSAPRLDMEGTEESRAPLVMLKFALWAVKGVGKIVIFLAGVAVALEIGCRWTEKALGREIFVPPMRPSRYAELPYVLPPGVGWAQEGVGYSINEWGVRGAKIDLIKPPNTVRIILLGGTALFGERVLAEQTVAERLGTLLAGEKGSSRYEVINGGVWGYSPQEQWAFYEKAVFELKPDILVW